MHHFGCTIVECRCNIVTCRYSSRRQSGRLVVGGTRTLFSSFSQDWGAKSLMRPRSSKDGVLLFFKPYVVFVLLVILNKWFSQHNSFRICELCSYLGGSGERFKWVFSTSHFQWYILWEFFVNKSLQCDYSFKGWSSRWVELRRGLWSWGLGNVILSRRWLLRFKWRFRGLGLEEVQRFVEKGCSSTLTYFLERIISANNMILIQYSRIQPETHNPIIYDA